MRSIETNTTHNYPYEEIFPDLIKFRILHYLEIYRGNKIVTFDNASPISNHREEYVNQNSVDAVNEFLTNDIKSLEPLLVIGPMASGKTTFECLLYEQLNKRDKIVNILLHYIDKERPAKKIFTHGKSEKGFDIDDNDTKQYEAIDNLIGKNPIIEWSNIDFLIVDEFMFTGEEDEDPPAVDPKKIKQLLDLAKENKVKLIITGIHSDYTGNIWPNMWCLINQVPRIYEFQGNCNTEGCNNKSILTNRRTSVTNKQGKTFTRPSSFNENRVRAGCVSNGKEFKDAYLPCCPKCLKAWTTQEAEEFDKQIEQINGDYTNFEMI